MSKNDASAISPAYWQPTVVYKASTQESPNKKPLIENIVITAASEIMHFVVIMLMMCYYLSVLWCVVVVFLSMNAYRLWYFMLCCGYFQDERVPVVVFYVVLLLFFSAWTSTGCRILCCVVVVFLSMNEYRLSYFMLCCCCFSQHERVPVVELAGAAGGHSPHGSVPVWLPAHSMDAAVCAPGRLYPHRGTRRERPGAQSGDKIRKQRNTVFP